MRQLIAFMIRRRLAVVIVTALFTLFLLSQLRGLSVIIDPDNVMPQSHPYIVTNNLVEKIFGNKFTVVVGVTATEGTIFQSQILQKVSRIHSAIMGSPGVVTSNVSSLASRKSKNIEGNEEGMKVEPLMEKVPETPESMDKLKKALASNPVYSNFLVSRDEKTTQIVAEFRRLPGGMKEVYRSIQAAVEPERDASVQITIAGAPVFLALLETFSERMSILFPLALLIIGLIHYEAFRTVQALILPLVTALFAVLWALGFLALMGQPLDVFNSSTPILILAIAAGHAVQILKRYYEEYQNLARDHPKKLPLELNHEAVLQSISKVGPVMVVACTIAALGFFSLVIFEIKTIRIFGLFTGVGIMSALVLELSFIPALRAMLPAPKAKELAREHGDTFWDRVVGRFFHLAWNRRPMIYSLALLLIGILSLGAFWLKIDNSQKAYFYGKIQARIDDDLMNSRLAGTNPIYVLVEGTNEDRIKDPKVLQAMEALQNFLEKNPDVGKTVSIVDFIKRMNQAMNEDHPDAYRIPDSQELVAQYLLLYSNSGEPGDFDSFVDYGYQRALVQAFLKTDSSAKIEALNSQLRAFAEQNFPKDLRISIGGGATSGVALNEVMIREKILNILQIMGAVFIVSALVFRSLLAGCLILVPLLAAVFVNFGVMGILGIPLQIATALVSAMAVGIGADYGIYMSYRLREELAQGKDEYTAVRKAFLSAGKAALFVSSAVAGGFGVLMFSFGFMIHLWMGFLIALAMLVSSIAALTIFPALIFTLRPHFIYKERNKSMNVAPTPRIAMLALLTGLYLGSITRAEAGALTADEIMKQNFVTSKVVDSSAKSKFRLFNARGQERVRETSGFTRLIPGTTDNMRLVTFESPADVRGTKTLLVENNKGDDDMWIYLPALKKVRRLVASNKKDSFVGTDFSYGDVIGHRLEEWSHKILREEKEAERDCFVIESMPKSTEVASNSGYSRRVAWIDKESFVALKGEAYDAGGQLLKRFKTSDIKKVDEKLNRWQPMKLLAENVQTGTKTIIEFENYKANIGVSDELFSARSLEKK